MNKKTRKSKDRIKKEIQKVIENKKELTKNTWQRENLNDDIMVKQWRQCSSRQWRSSRRARQQRLSSESTTKLIYLVIV